MDSSTQPPVNAGQRVVLIRMHDDPDPVSPGTMGTVHRVILNERGWVIGVDWDDGRPCPLVPGDRFIIELDPPEELLRDLGTAIVYDFPPRHAARTAQIPLFAEAPDPICNVG